MAVIHRQSDVSDRYVMTSQSPQNTLRWNPTCRTVQHARYSYDVITRLHSSPCIKLKLCISSLLIYALLVYNLEYNYLQHNYLLVFININYMVTCSDQRFITFSPVHDIKIKLQLRFQSNHKINLQL